MKVLVDQLKEASSEVRGQAAESLGKLGAEARSAVPALIDRIADDVWNPGFGTRDSSSGNSSKDAGVVALRVLSPARSEEALIRACKSGRARTGLGPPINWPQNRSRGPRR